MHATQNQNLKTKRYARLLDIAVMKIKCFYVVVTVVAVAHFEKAERLNSLGVVVTLWVLECNTILLVTLLQALLYPESDGSWDILLESLLIRGIESLTESCSHNIRRHSEQLLRDLTNTEVISVERGDESSRFTVWVELSVYGSLVERLHLEFANSVGDDSSLSIGIIDSVLG